MNERLRRTLEKRRARQAAAEAKNAHRSKIAEAVMAGKEELEAAAQRLGVHSSALHERVRRRAAKQARDRIPDGAMPLLLDAHWRDALFEELDRESGCHLPLTWRLERVLTTCEVSDAQIRHLLRCGWNEINDQYIEALIFREEFPVDLLLSLIDSNRFLTAIAHRAGPREVLKIVAKKYESNEPIMTLLQIHKDQCLAEDLLAFIREHHTRLKRPFLEEIEMSELRRQQVLDLFDKLQGS